MDAGSTDADYALVHREVVGPVLDEFRPELLLVSAGFDAHERDPLASMRMTTEGYGAVVGLLRDVARRHGALALVTEGGYELSALAACLDASIAAIDAPSSPALVTSKGGRGAAAVAGTKAALARYWSSL